MLQVHEQNIPFQVIQWDKISKEEHRGENGTSFWQTVERPGLRLRIVEYSPGYLADHWCKKGHIVYCLEGSFVSELQNAESFSLSHQCNRLKPKPVKSGGIYARNKN